MIPGRTRIGIHRPYFTQSIGAKSIKDMEDRQRALNTAARNYLFEMDVSTSLYDKMMSVPSGQLKFLSDDEIELFFPRETFAREAYGREVEARKRGVSPAQYLARERDADQHCSISSASAGAFTQYGFCREAALLGISPETLRERMVATVEKCGAQISSLEDIFVALIAIEVSSADQPHWKVAACQRLVLLGKR